MHGVVLAAGRGSRLSGIVAPFHKPLLVVNGLPLVVHAVESALEASRLVTVVVSPENAAPIAQVLRAHFGADLHYNIRIVVQVDADGPGVGVYTALRGMDSEPVLILCADNIIPKGTTSMMAEMAKKGTAAKADRAIICGATVPWRESMRFAFRGVEDRIYEGDSAHVIRNLNADDAADVTCWLGPVVLTSSGVKSVLLSIENEITRVIRSEPECKLAPHLNAVQSIEWYIPVVPCVDVGVPEAIA